jgi:hypothetical protein
LSIWNVLSSFKNEISLKRGGGGGGGVVVLLLSLKEDDSISIARLIALSVISA